MNARTEPHGQRSAASDRVVRAASAGIRACGRALRRCWHATPIGSRIQFGRLRRLTPISSQFGFDRGLPIDRHYIEEFLRGHAADIGGRVLEIGDAAYTRRFGGPRVARSDVLHAVAGNPAATIIGNLATGEGIPREAFDCIVLTQTLPFVFDIAGAVRSVHAALNPGGVVLATVPGISQVSRYDMDRWGDFWRFTPLSARRLFAEVFAEESLSVESHGNVLAAVALLHGLASEELRARELAYNDRDYPVIVAVRAQRTTGQGEKLR
jgi:hypothetical protein